MTFFIAVMPPHGKIHAAFAHLDACDLGRHVVADGRNLHAAEAIVGDLSNIASVSIGWHDDVDVAREEIGAAVNRVATERDSLASGVDDHQSVLTSVWLWAFTPKNFSKTRSAAGAAAVDPWPPFSITAQTTMRGASVSDGP